MIYIIGDSHVSIFSGVDTRDNGEIHIQPEWGYCYEIKGGEFISLRHHNPFEQKLDGVFAIKFGSYTAYNLESKMSKLDEILNAYEISNNDIVLLCFGEIDIRAHIGFKIEENCSLDDTIKTCVDRYITILKTLSSRGMNVGVFAPAASLPNELIYSAGPKYKDSQTRNRMTTKFNSYLKTKCDENDFIFKDIHKDMLRLDYTSDPKYFRDNIHLSKNALPFIKRELKDIL